MRGLRLDRYLAANLLTWLVTYLLLTVRGIAGAMTLTGQGQMSVRRAVVCLASVGVCVLIQRALLASKAWPFRKRLLLAGGLSVAGGLFYTAFNHFVFYIAWPKEAWKEDAASLGYALVMNFSVLIWSFIVWCAVVFAMGYDEEAREKTLRLAQAQALAAESQTRMLRYQINPHFLFNTLNALSSLILQKDHVRAERTVLSLSKFLRASLEATPGEMTPLAREIEAQREYLAIEQIRFDDRLRLHEDVPADLGSALVPSLILQPLVENAVKYGVAQSSRPVRIAITAAERDGRLVVTVEDDGCADVAGEAVHLGVGLENVRRRLDVLYGTAGVLTCGPCEGGGFAATIALPIQRADDRAGAGVGEAA